VILFCVLVSVLFLCLVSIFTDPILTNLAESLPTLQSAHIGSRHVVERSPQGHPLWLTLAADSSSHDDFAAIF
jgi:hypothetical protein